MADDQPVRFTLPLPPSFRVRYELTEVIGESIRWMMGDDVVMVGTVVSWSDAAGGGVILTVEASAEG